MVIDAKKRFARKAATWIIQSKASRDPVALSARLQMFSQDHVKLIHDEFLDIRGQTKNPR